MASKAFVKREPIFVMRFLRIFAIYRSARKAKKSDDLLSDRGVDCQCEATERQ